MCVGFLYTDIMRELSDFGITEVSKKGMDPSALASSVVKWICGSILLIYSRNFSFFDDSMTTKSSTYLFYTLDDGQLC